MLNVKFANPGTGRGFSEALWGRYLSRDLLANRFYVGHGVAQVDDFLDLPTGAYTATQAVSGTFALATGGSDGGTAVADSGAAVAGQGVNVQSPPFIRWESGEELVFEARMTPAAITTAGNLFIGLAITDPTVIAANAMACDDYVGFRGLGTNDLTFCSKKDNGTEQASTSAVYTMVSGTPVRLGFVVTRTGLAIPYVNGVELNTSAYRLSASSTARPTDVMGFTLVVQSRGTTQPTVGLDYCGCAKEKTYA